MPFHVPGTRLRVLFALSLWAVAPLSAQAPELPPDFDKLPPEQQQRIKKEMERSRDDVRRGDVDRAPRTREEQEKLRAQHDQKLPPPSDPAKVRASYFIDGQQRTITEGDFYSAYDMLWKFEHRPGTPVSVDRTYEHMLGLAEALAMGFECTDEEFRLADPLMKNPTLLEQARVGWQAGKDGPTEELYVRYGKETRTLQKLKDFWANNVRVTSQEVFDAYKTNHFRFRLQYLQFTPEEFAGPGGPPREEDLRRFWNDDKGVRAQFQAPATVDVEYVYSDQSTAAPDNGSGSREEIGYAQALAYYRQHKERLDGLIPAEERAGLQPDAKVDPATLKTPFQILRPIIDKEIRLSGRVRVAFQEALTAPGADLKALAAKHGLSHVRLDKAERHTFATDARFGHQAFGVLYAAEPGKLSPDVQTERTVQFFWRLNAKTPSTVPEFDSMTPAQKEKLVASYLGSAGGLKAGEAARAAREALEQAASAEMQRLDEAAKQEATRLADQEIRGQNVTDPKRIDEIRQRHEQQARMRSQPKRDEALGSRFEAVAAEKGWKIHDTGVFELTVPRGPAGSPEETRLAFLKMQPALRAMKEGSVSSVAVEPTTKTHFIYRLAQRAEPDPAAIPASDHHAMRAQTERTKSMAALNKCMLHEIRNRLGFQTY
ncbi:MAG TPA: hypothetical protein VEI02_07605 [Planctomycetota bacterium]|nr:hypothetical protein [Planctomycetota bacterium]